MRLIDYAVVILVLLFAMALRISGTATFGALDEQNLPSSAPYDMLHIQAPLQPDEYLLVALPYDMTLKQRSNPQFFEYPSGIMYLNYVLYQMTGTLDGVTLADRDGVNLRTIAPFSLYFFSRLYSVLAGVIAVACAYGILRRVSGRFAALMAALLLATSFILVQHAHYIKPGTPSAGLMMLALWASVMALYSRKLQSTYSFYIASGMLTGAAATVRYNAAAIGIVLFLVGLILLWRQRTKQMFISIIASWLLVPVTFFIGTPFAILDFNEFYRQFVAITGQFLSSGNNIAPEILTTPQHGFMILMRFLIVFGTSIPATIAIPIGIFGAWRERPKQLLKDNSEHLLIGLLVLFIVAYIFVTMRTVRPIFSDNLIVLIVPQCLLLSAIGAGWLYDNIRVPKTVLAPLIACGLLIMPLALTIPMVSLISQTETRVRMQEWVYEHIPLGSRFLLLEAYNVPLDPTIYPYDQNFNIRGFRLSDAENYDYLLISDARLDLYARADVLVTDEEFAPYQSQLTLIEANFPRLAWIDRPRDYLGYADMMNMAAYWHQPSLTLYCLNETACATRP
ncbi:MAG: glycosyltransferase family 39 protein [Anaerolineae bacterium]|nr:glycosyltransferase family 39 protein [Anaerolineae bacterium]